ncbi:hypothetical protein K505DRAFT_378965 [Melanomma pulvis-pyrius CBS 109.77]|uniref:2EXR domain-containing protein n=1 Tax=Melanomma pulvis-pyrius CBS 109.77 TaxID=1314802 RepID=A0A6A6WW51_9PLEO|nr:hypothetical protein K505DRAFT_378965 [Melanomma pulvis-pyrius CBS 109.77]
MMGEVKHYGTFDLYDPDRPAGETSVSSKIDAQALGRNVRAWMRNRLRSKTSREGAIKTESIEKPATNEPTPPPATSPINAIDPSKPTFSSLPGEIRNNIYHLSLFPRHPSLLAIYYSHPQDIFRTLLRNPLFRVSRQIRAEALSFLAATKDFRLPGVCTATTFFRYIGPIGRANLTSVTLAFLSPNNVEMEGGSELLRLLKEVRGSGLKRFTVGLQFHTAMSEGAWMFLKRLREALVSECEEIEVKWCFLENGVTNELNGKSRRIVGEMEKVYGKENRIYGSIWELVDVKCI